MQFRGAKLFEIMLFVYFVFGRIYILPVYVFRPYFNSTPFFSGCISPVDRLDLLRRSFLFLVLLADAVAPVVRLDSRR